MNKTLLFVLALLVFSLSNHFAFSKESEALPPVTSKSKLQQISLETSANITQLKFQASGGLSDVIEEKLSNPGRLILDFQKIESTDEIPVTALNDKALIPRVRLATKPDRLRIIIDTVVENFPVYQISKSNNELIIRVQKTPEQVQEALTKAKLFAAIQKGDHESQLKMGSEDEGGLLFEGSNAKMNSASASVPSNSPSSLVREAPSAAISADGSKRVVFMLQDNKPYKIFLEESQTPVHIERIRPGYEVKGVQARLTQLGYNAGLVDGDVGVQTKEALKKFQKDKGLAVTGTPNKKTQRELRKEFGY